MAWEEHRGSGCRGSGVLNPASGRVSRAGAGWWRAVEDGDVVGGARIPAAAPCMHRCRPRFRPASRSTHLADEVAERLLVVPALVGGNLREEGGAAAHAAARVQKLHGDACRWGVGGALDKL